MRGEYLFADFVQPNRWSIQTGVILQGTTIPATRFQLRNADFTPTAGTIDNVVAFGTDASGNVYMVDFDGEIFVIEPVPGAGGAFSASTLAAPQAVSQPMPSNAALSKEESAQLARRLIRESLTGRR